MNPRPDSPDATLVVCLGLLPRRVGTQSPTSRCPRIHNRGPAASVGRATSVFSTVPESHTPRHGLLGAGTVGLSMEVSNGG